MPTTSKSRGALVLEDQLILDLLMVPEAITPKDKASDGCCIACLDMDREIVNDVWHQVLKEDLDVLRLTFYSAPVSIMVLLPFFLTMELGPLLEYRQAGPSACMAAASLVS